MTNMSIRMFSARTMQFNIASLLLPILNFPTVFFFIFRASQAAQLFSFTMVLTSVDN